MQEATKIIPKLKVTLNAPQGPLGIIRAQGADTVKFLQGQLTQDVALMGLTEARLSAWCSAKGRMTASFVVIKLSQDDVLLVCSSSVLTATLKRLQMFVLRAQCKLSDATAQFCLQGLAAGDAQPAQGQLVAWGVSRVNDHLHVQLPQGFYLGSPVDRALSLEALPAEHGASSALVPALEADLGWWQYLEVSSGIAAITAPIVDAFVPQMLNYESVGGVNFKKGCYPGQEVVARSQFRGTLKRRAFIASCHVAVAPGQEVFDSREPDQPCGMVASAGQAPSKEPGQWHWLAVVSMQTSATGSERLSVGGIDGPVLQLQTLPYALLEDI